MFLGTHEKRLTKELLMSTHNICFCAEIKKNISNLQLKKVPYVDLWSRLVLEGSHNTKNVVSK